MAANPGRNTRAAKLRQLSLARNKIVEQRLNVYPDTPLTEKPELAHRIQQLCVFYTDLKTELGVR